MSPRDPFPPVWRLGRSFSPSELDRRLHALEGRPTTGPASDLDALDPSFRHYFSEAVIAREHPGPPQPGGAFERARSLVESYAFSDPSVVQGHFDASRPMLDRPILLELKVLGVHVLCGVVVRETRNDSDADRSVYGFRYDTLQGHPESGSEWFLLTKEHDTGDVKFRIQATWREGHLQSIWLRFGFHAFAQTYQRIWHRRAYLRLRRMLASQGLPALPRFGSFLQKWDPRAPGLKTLTKAAPAPAITPEGIIEHES